MKIELNFYRQSGKWYTTEEIDIYDLDLIAHHVGKHLPYKDMNYTAHLIESDGHLQPLRLYLR